nr:substrate-binding domain-containing protein [Campylobacter sp. CS_ED1]
MQAKSIEVSKFLPFDENSQIYKTKADLNLQGDLPVIDGAAALFPVFSAFVGAVYPASSVEFDGKNFTEKSRLKYTNTRGAYKAVVDKKADLIFVAKPSNSQLQYAKENGVDLEFVPIGLEAFVFIVRNDNPVSNLSTTQIKEIYSGKITKWSQVGGVNLYIDAVQRN